MQVSCLSLSASGRYLASGQVSFMGFPAPIIIWDLKTRTVLHTLSLHKVRLPLPAGEKVSKNFQFLNPFRRM